jgi:uncharacterized protein involved in exopolysaccharide biosynthesis
VRADRVRPALTLGFRLTSAASSALPVREVLTGAFFHRRLLLVAFVVPVLLGLVAAAASRTMFLGEARLMILYGSEFFFAPAAGAGGVVLDRNQVILGELQILQSAELAGETLQSLGARHVYPEAQAGGTERAIGRFAKDLTVASIPQSNVIALGFRNPDPDVVVDVLTTLIDRYLARRTAVFEKPSLRAAELRRTALAGELAAAESDLAAFARAHGITNPDEQISLMLQQSFTIAAGLREVAAAVREAEAKLVVVRRRLAASPRRIRVFSEVQRSQQAQAATEALTAAQTQLAALRARFGPNAPEVRERESQIAAIRAQLGRAPATEGAVEREGENPVFTDIASRAAGLEADLEGLRARRAALEADAAALAGPLAELNLAARSYGELKRRRDLLDEEYRSFSRELGHARAAAAIEGAPQTNIRVLQPPERPGQGQNPRLTLAAGGVALGLLCAAAVLALLQQVRPVLLSVREAEQALGLPVLAVVGLKPGRLGGTAMSRVAAPSWSAITSAPTPAE